MLALSKTMSASSFVTNGYEGKHNSKQNQPEMYISVMQCITFVKEHHVVKDRRCILQWAWFYTTALMSYLACDYITA